MTSVRSLAAIALGLLAFAGHADDARRRSVSPQVPLERVLIPFTATLVHDPPNDWTAELIVSNDGPDDISIAYQHPCIVGIPTPVNDFCAPRVERISPHSLITVAPWDGARGSFLYVTRDKFGHLAHTLHVENSTLGLLPRPVLGTELPLIREAQFTGRVHLLNVPPGGPSLRTILRVYGESAGPFTVHVAIAAVDHGGEKLVDSLELPLSSGTIFGDFDVNPSFAQLDLTDRIANHRSIPPAPVTVEVTSPGPEKFWAFIAVINDQTHEWTNISADR
jgi:hypothetical protein